MHRPFLPELPENTTRPAASKTVSLEPAEAPANTTSAPCLNTRPLTRHCPSLSGSLPMPVAVEPTLIPAPKFVTHSPLVSYGL